MQPIYATKLVEVYHADALDVLASLETEIVDLVLTDPPYGVEWQSERRAETFDQLLADTPDDRAGIRAVMTEAVRVLGQNRHLYAFGPTDVLDGLKLSAPAPLVWNKLRPGMGDLSSPWGPAHEPITFATSKYRHAGEAGRENLPVRMRKGSVLDFAPPTGRNVRHPSEKPVALLAELIESSTRQGDRVLDPFAGSGSTGVAAILAGRRAILVEIHRPYVDITIDRVRRAEQLRREMVEV
jgi:site-specific DNA-methyltransferase (adenine-specific)